MSEHHGCIEIRPTRSLSAAWYNPSAVQTSDSCAEKDQFNSQLSLRSGHRMSVSCLKNDATLLACNKKPSVPNCYL